MTEAPAQLSKPKFVIPMLALATCALIWANWNSPFFSFDDADHLQQATESAFTNCLRLDIDQTFLPVSSLSLRLDRALFGPPSNEIFFKPPEEGGVPLDEAKFKAQTGWATATRVENALLHFLAGVILWYFLIRIGASPGIAFMTAVAWTGHPMACESVAWISERKNVLSTLFGFAAMLAWTARSGSWWRWPLLSILYLLSTLSKPTGVGFFPILVALEFINPPAGSGNYFAWSHIRNTGIRLIAPTLITLFIVWVGIHSHQVHFVEYAGGSLLNALLTDLEIFSRYIGNTLLPVNLSFFYGVDPIRSLADWRVWVFGAFIVLTLAALVGLTRGVERRLAFLGIIWFFAALGPVANIAPIPYWMHDRYVYASSAGLLLAFVCCAWSVLKLVGVERHAPIAGGIFLGMLLLLAGARAKLFTDSDLLAFEAADKFKNSTFAQVNAYTAARYRIQKLSVVPGPAAAEAREFFIKKATEYFDTAVHRDDLTQFREEFTFRVVHAEMLLETGRIEQALECLKDFLPPTRLKMRQPDQKFRASEVKEFYPPQTLARAWLVHAQAMLAQANPPGTPLLKLPLARRFELCDEAAKSLQKSITVFDWDQQAFFLKAAVDLTRAELEKLNNRPAEAAKLTVAARAQLEAIPRKSPTYANARQLLESLGLK